MPRLRIKFYKGQETKYISHLDLMRLWERALHRAGMQLAYSEGFSPHPRISLAAPLALGVTSRAELMDIVLVKVSSPHFFTAVVNSKLPAGVGILQAHNIGLNEPSLQSLVRQAEYETSIKTENGKNEIETSINRLLGAEHLPWKHLRDTGPRHYDLRALIDELWLVKLEPPLCTIGMRLRCGSNGSGRPEQVLKALGFDQHAEVIQRTKLILK
jgi:radical SAM-linked protein